MAGLMYKSLRVVLSASYMFFFGCLFTLLKPLRKNQNNELKLKARQLNINAAKKLGADSVFVELSNGIKLHVVEAGDRKAKLVVLLHGFPDVWHCWSGIIPDLVKQGYFVVAPDMRGYNLSDKPKDVNDYRLNFLVSDIKALIAYYGKNNAVVAAHDWGGIVAWSLAERYPESVEKLVILNSPHPAAYQEVVRKDIKQALNSWYILFFQIPFIPVNLISYNPHTAVSFFFQSKRGNLVSKEGQELLACSYAQDNAVPSMLNYYKAMVRGEISAAMKARNEKRGKREEKEKVKVPTLILWGQNDVALIPELAMANRWVQDLKVSYIPNCTHWVPYEVPEIVSREMIKFIA